MMRRGLCLLLLGGAAMAADLEAVFARTADQALNAMQAQAEALKIQGAAVVAYFPEPEPGHAITGWTSRMRVVGAFVLKGKTNVLGVVYSKMAEMADTLQDSGSKVRPPYTGENGFQGGLIAHVSGGYLIAAMSGGWDQRIAKVGLDVLKAAAEAPPKP